MPTMHLSAYLTCPCPPDIPLYLQAAQAALRRAILQQYLQLKLDSWGCFAEEASVLFDNERVFSTRHIEQVRPHQRLLLYPEARQQYLTNCKTPVPFPVLH